MGTALTELCSMRLQAQCSCTVFIYFLAVSCYQLTCHLMLSISSAFHVSLILTITDNFQADLLACFSLVRILNFHLLNVLIFLYSHVIFAFFSKSKKSSEIGIIFTFN